LSYGGIEAGGTKWVCAVGTGPDDIRASVTIPTGAPAATIGAALEFFTAHPDLIAIGVGSFGPIDVRPDSPTWGRFGATPKLGWEGVDLVGELRTRLDVPIALDTDVNAAALGELHHGAGRGLDTFCYITVGTGIGGGGVVNGGLLHGLLHPEFGHMRVPHDRVRDPFDGACRFHGDCLEGLAAGEAIRLRWGYSGEVAWHEEALELEAEYLATGLWNVASILSPQRIVLGGGVMDQPGLLSCVQRRLTELAGGYFADTQLETDVEAYVVPPALGARAGVLGAIELARVGASSYLNGTPTGPGTRR
jgi:fructokinase